MISRFIYYEEQLEDGGIVAMRKIWGSKKIRTVALYILVVLLAISVIGTVAIASGESGVIKNAILISWDGVQRDHLRELLETGSLPNLKGLIEEGTIVEIDVTHKTDTKAGHAQMLTGYGPEVTGVYSNSVYQPIPKGYTIFERLEEAFGKDGIATIMITGKGGNLGSKGPSSEEPLITELSRKQLEKKGVSRDQVLERLKKVFGDDNVGRAIISIITEAPSKALKKLSSGFLKSPEGMKVKRRLAMQSHRGEPFYNAKPAIDLFQGDKARPADEVGKLALDSLDQYGKGRFFAFFHFSDPDHAGHKYGENSREYSDAIIAADKWLGRIVQKLKELGVYEETRIYVTSDHGFDEGKTSHSMAPYVFLATNDPEIKRRGDQRDIVPTLLARMGFDISKVDPPLLGRLLTEPEKPW
ncbi:MAG TPA: sulfatase-like hydrolase/transferase [Firmicutes bacterium]|nr:sulfatase-like hydrolase/transferase [Bacillota bacterium]